MTIRLILESDFTEWQRMRTALWPGQSPEDMREWRARTDAVTLVFDRDNARLGGFAELGLRSIADGCATGPVAYLEGWWVDPDLRRRGIGAELIRAGEEWARSRGLKELASDVELANDVSQRAHHRLGFEEVGRSVLYRK
ncbi:MAG: GNAT family N-acetyltransferase, partial [Gemmatimonadota bacterium]